MPRAHRVLFVVAILVALVPSQSASAAGPTAAAATVIKASTDYPPAAWFPADPANYTVADRPHDYPVDMIIIHDVEGSYDSAIQAFQDPNAHKSAHYVVSAAGDIAQTVAEHDIAWHAGNYDYNTRAIGIEHEGFAYIPGSYTTAEYQASAQLSASICSRWGVPMDRAHVIGHYEVPDPNNPGLFGGEDNHTDPGPYWDWDYYMSLAQAYANALPSPPHLVLKPVMIPMSGGATVSWDGRSCHGGIDGYQVVIQPGNTVVRLPGTATSTTLTGLQNGTTYTVTVTASNSYGQDSQSASLIPSPPCTSPTLAVAPSSPGATGGTVIFTGGATGCTNPTYRFWIQPPGGAWGIVRDYGPASSYSWTATGLAGSYRTEVDVRQQTSSVAYDAVFNLTYALVGCSAAKLSADSLSPEPPGTRVVLTGSATCPGAPEYRFWMWAPGNNWTIVQDYSPSATYSWNTTGKSNGSYSLEVDVRNHNAAIVYETVANMTYVLGPAICHNATLNANPASPSATGSVVSFSSSSTGCSDPRYRFWISPPDGSWSIVQDYSASNTFAWAGTGSAGSYRAEVDVRDQASSESYDSVKDVAYVLGGCSAAQLTTDKPSPQATGIPAIVLTGSGTCPGTPEYRFWVRTPDGSWSIVHDYSPTATFSWSTAALPAGSYGLEVDVRDHGATDSYERVVNATFTLGGCSAAGLSTDKPSPQTVGTPIVLTGSATCLGTATYRFWILAPGGNWTIIRDYSPSNTLNWNTTGKPAGTYGLEVDVRELGATVVYEKVFNITYRLA